jgi:hypothetical protein
VRHQKVPNYVPVPSALGKRRTIAFITQELVAMLKQSDMIDALLTVPLYDDLPDLVIKKIGRNTRNVRAGLARTATEDDDDSDNDTDDEADDEADDDTVKPSVMPPLLPFDIKAGDTADTKEFSCLHAFGNPNLQPTKLGPSVE